MAEITGAKNSINQRAVLERRSALVDTIYDGSDPDLILPQDARGAAL